MTFANSNPENWEGNDDDGVCVCIYEAKRDYIHQKVTKKIHLINY